MLNRLTRLLQTYQRCATCFQFCDLVRSLDTPILCSQIQFVLTRVPLPCWEVITIGRCLTFYFYAVFQSLHEGERHVRMTSRKLSLFILQTHMSISIIYTFHPHRSYLICIARGKKITCVEELSISGSCLQSMMKLNCIPGSTPYCILNEIQFTSLLPYGHLSRINNIPRCTLQFVILHYFPCSWQMFAVVWLTAIDFFIRVQVN